MDVCEQIQADRLDWQSKVLKSFCSVNYPPLKCGLFDPLTVTVVTKKKTTQGMTVTIIAVPASKTNLVVSTACFRGCRGCSFQRWRRRVFMLAESKSETITVRFLDIKHQKHLDLYTPQSGNDRSVVQLGRLFTDSVLCNVCFMRCK